MTCDICHKEITGSYENVITIRGLKPVCFYCLEEQCVPVEIDEARQNEGLNWAKGILRNILSDNEQPKGKNP